MNNRVERLLLNNKEDMISKWTQEMKENSDERIVNVVSDQVFTSTSREFIELIISTLIEQQGATKSKIDEFVDKMVHLGWTLNFVTDGIKTFGKIMLAELQSDEGLTDKERVQIQEDVDPKIMPFYNDIIRKYTSTWEKTVSLQRVALKELSAPLIPVFEGITVMPLIGTIDTERAKQIMESLLSGVVKHRSEVVLIDITGVPLVDTMVAHHIIQSAEAVRLVGAKCLLVGIRPEIAQTIVNLGIDLERFVTKNTLKKGVETALTMTNRKIVKTEGSE